MIKNNLAKSSSPYLLQHKDNPVHWQTWSKDSLKLAKESMKPILLSIGYASCHWCHVMAHESFEDAETAELMNKNFINIKVDREERPDIDFVFQSSYQIFNQSGGGWPLTMFLDENAIPFMGGTYFPKDSKNEIPSFTNVLNKVAEVYNKNKEEIKKQANLVSGSLELKKNSVLSQDLEPILDDLISNLDQKKGGYKGAPKFPTFYIFDTFLYFYNKTKNEKFLKPVNLILKKLCSGGIYDHVEGGISRYTVDENWLIPHFEKMLYDNAQFVLLLSKYVKIDSNDYFKSKITQTIDFINNKFINKKSQLLGSAYDADSEGEEGKYYTFSFEEIKNIKDIEKYFDISSEGNWDKKIILKEIAIPPNGVINELLKIRNNKKKPFFDHKIQLDLNCIWISALVSAHQVMPNKNYLDQAEEYFKNIKNKFFQKNLYHCNSLTDVFLEDYAYTINSLIDLSEQTLKPEYKIKAKHLCEEAITKFYIKEKKIFQKNTIDNNDLFYRPIDIADHTISNGNSVMLINFTRLGYKKEAEELSNTLNGYLNVYKSFMTSSVKAIDFFKEVSSGKKCNDEGCQI